MLSAIDHVNIVVDSMDDMVAFYRDVLGFAVTRDVAIDGAWLEALVGLPGARARVIYLSLPEGPKLELIDYHAPPGDRPPGQDRPHARGLRHMAFRVADVDAVAQRLNDAGVTLMSPPQTVPNGQVTFEAGARKRLVYFHDPEGNLLELCAYG